MNTVLIAWATLFGCGALLAQEASTVDSACALQGVCTFRDAQMLVNDYVDTVLTIIDAESRVLYASLASNKFYLRRQDGTRELSKAGSAEERCLLEKLKEALRKDPYTEPHDASEDSSEREKYWTKHPEQKEKFWTQEAVKRLIRCLERRCAGPPGSR